LRAAHARTTRAAIVDAAARLFVERGYGATTVDAIAEAADVSRKTVFTSVGGKLQALKLAIDWAIVGDEEDVPMLERPFVKAAYREPDARRILTDYAQTARGVSERSAALHEVLQSAAGLDADLRALADEGRDQRQRGMTALAQLLTEREALRPGLSTAEAADALWLFSDPAVYTRLVAQQGWLADRYEQWLGDVLVSVLLAGDYRPSVR